MSQRPVSIAVHASAASVETVAAGTLRSGFSVTSNGAASVVTFLDSLPSRRGEQPALALAYDSSATSGGDVVGAGFSLQGLPGAVTWCPRTLLRDGELREVRHDGKDPLCYQGKRLVPVGQAPGIIEFRTLPDTFVKVIGHYPAGDEGGGVPISFEVIDPSGLITTLGNSAASRPRGWNGVPRAYLPSVSRTARGETTEYTFCFADAGDVTVEYALTELRYGGFDGPSPLEPTRAVKLIYEPRDVSEVRLHYENGIALQNSLQLKQIQMVGGGALVRRYELGYERSHATSKMLLTHLKECSGAKDGVCKPATRFLYQQNSQVGFVDHTTVIPTPMADRASPVLADLDGDGLSEIIVPDTGALSMPGNPITEWLVARNRGPSGSQGFLEPTTLGFSQKDVVAEPSGPSDPALIQPELGTPLRYDDDSRTDILLHDVYGGATTWQILLGQPDNTFQLHNTGIPRPFPLGVSPAGPGLTSQGGAMHLLDADGDKKSDMAQCEDHGTTAEGDPSKAVWTLHRWLPASDSTEAGFDPEGESIKPLAGVRCDTELFTVDLSGDGKSELVVRSKLEFRSDGTEIPAASYHALTRRSDGSWEIFDTRLPVVASGGRVVFADVSGDGLPDAIESGFSDHMLRTYMNTGRLFAELPVTSLGSLFVGLGEQDTFFRLAVPIQYNGDSRQDLLMPLPAGMGFSTTQPTWAILQAKSGPQNEATFTVVDPHLPFEAEVGDAITLADPHGPRVADINGDSADDIVLPVGGVFHVFENLAHDQDVLVAVSEGMNAHDPEDEGFVPTISISYGHLSDASITNDIAADDPARESLLYISRSDPANECKYPRACSVGSRRVVSAFAVNDGTDAVRRFSVRYRDGRYDRLGNGDLEFGERIITDLDTGAGTADFYDNITFDEDLKVFPFAGRVTQRWIWNPGLPTQPKPEQIELSFVNVTPTLVPTNDKKTYFTLPTQVRLRREQGVYSPGGGSPPTVEAYVREIESSGGATMLQDTTAKVTDFDAFGNPRSEEITTVGVDLTLHIDRTFKNDLDRWILGRLEKQKECSTASMLSQCRSVTRTLTDFGEVESESFETDDNSSETKLTITYVRDKLGNVTSVTADDAYDGHRFSSITYDPEGFFPTSFANAAGHTSFTEFDPWLGVLTKLTDPNMLVTEWKHDEFGRLGLEIHPDGSQTTITLSRSKDGGPKKDAWRVLQRSVTTGGADDTVEYDSRSRPIRWWWHGPATPRASGEPPRLMQQVTYNPLNGNIAQRSVPASEDTPAEQLLFDVYEHDARGREVRHTSPWNAITETSYDGLVVTVTDPLLSTTSTELDPLDRTVKVTDAAKGVTSYTYGPFGYVYTVTAPGKALTRMTRDPSGRVQELDDPDRGTTFLDWNGFGDLRVSTDALKRVVALGYDEQGRVEWRIEQKGAETLTTHLIWDTAEHGIGKLHMLDSPDALKTYSYTERGQLESVTLAIKGEAELLEAKLGYDDAGRVDRIVYPTPDGAPSFIVAQDYDPYGHVLKVRDSATNLPYWHLTDVDNAGRFRAETFGNGFTTERSYYADKQRLKSIVTELVTPSKTTKVQELSYEYDVLLNLKSRTDALQPQHKTERFHHDPLERLTCAYFSAMEDPFATCDLSYGYAPNGNLTFKSDVGILSYTDPAHPHAITGAGGGSYGYDAVGNQTVRPGGVTVSYTSFDLPDVIKEGALTVAAFDYDGDQQRIRKETLDQETLYFSDLYEKVTEKVSGTAEHRYYIHSPERVVAVVTWGGKAPGTLYTHVDHLDSIDVLTREDGTVAEHRSYDPFGQRRNPIWGQPLPPSFTSKTTKGFTGHESDEELGLVNMKGRIYDPKLGRFLTTDPIVPEPLSGQSWNPYSYVGNNPLAFIDPSGFDEEPPGVILGGAQQIGPEGEPEIVIYIRPPSPPGGGGSSAEQAKDASQLGIAVPPIDVDPTGSSSTYEPELPPTAPGDGELNRGRQILAAEDSLFGGLTLGTLPFIGLVHTLLEETGVLSRGSLANQRGLAVGKLFGGALAVVGGATGEVLGGALTTTGIGALLGVPVMAVSTGLVVGGLANIGAGIRDLTQLSMSQGSGSSGPQGKASVAEGPKAGSEGGSGAGQRFGEGVKEDVRTGQCVFCGKPTTREPGPSQSNIDHAIPKSRGGNNTVENAQEACRTCNLEKRARTTEEYLRSRGK